MAHALLMNDAETLPATAAVVTGLRAAREDITPALAAEWDSLHALGVASPYQARRWVEAWYEKVSPHLGETPAVMTLRDEAGALAGLFPLVVSQSRLGTLARFVGGKHANYNMPLIAPRHAAGLDAKACHALLRQFAQHLPGIDAFHFINQPRDWKGAPAPFACMAVWPAVHASYALDLAEGGEAAMTRVMSKHARKILRAKRRKLHDMGELRFIRAETPEDITRIADAFEVQKAERFEAMGIANPFTHAGIMDFLRAGAMPTDAGDPPLVWHALQLDDRVISTTIGAVDGERFAGMASSFLAEPEIMKHSAGELLLTDIIADEALRGRRVFDLGVGESRYKTTFCDIVEQMVETVQPVSPRGYAILAALQMHRMAKQAGLSLQRRHPALARFARRALKSDGGG